MKSSSRIRSLLRNLFRKQRLERQLEDELQSYVEMLTDEKMAAGFSRSEARRVALKDIGGIEQVKQAVRDRRAGTSLEVVWQDVRYGWRQLVRNPGFTVAVIVTLALSIGANTAIFSIVNALMLQSLPYPHPERMGTIFRLVKGSEPFDGRHSISGEQFELLRDDVPSLMAAVSSRGTNGVNHQAGQHVEYVHDGRISARYLDVLGIHPALGRNFSDEEDRPKGQGPSF